MISAASLSTPFFSNLYYIAILRFILGVGLALAFAPGVTLMAKYFRKGSEGFSLGLFSGAFALGGLAGIPVWIVLAKLTGWRVSLTISGALSLVAFFLTAVSIPRDDLRPDFQMKFHNLTTMLFNRTLILVGTMLLSTQLAWNLVGYFVVFYLENELKVSPAVAGLIGSLTLVSAFVISPVAGRIYDNKRNPFRLLLFSGLLSAGASALLSTNTIYGVLISTVAVGVSFGIATIMAFGVARDEVELGQEYKSLGVAWVNGLAFIGSFWYPILFSQVAIRYGYAAAWLSASAATVILILASSFFALAVSRRTKKLGRFKTP